MSQPVDERHDECENYGSIGPDDRPQHLVLGFFNPVEPGIRGAYPFLVRLYSGAQSTVHRLQVCYVVSNSLMAGGKLLVHPIDRGSEFVHPSCQFRVRYFAVSASQGLSSL